MYGSEIKLFSAAENVLFLCTAIQTQIHKLAQIKLEIYLNS